MSHAGTAVALQRLVSRFLLSIAVAMVAAAAVSAQAPRLVDSVEAPLAYMSMEVAPVAAGARSQPGPVQKLLADPALGVLLGGSDAAGATRALALVRGLLTRNSGELEIALTGVVPNGGQPLLVLRARLLQSESKRLREVLDAGELAAPGRRFGANKAYRLRDAASQESAGRDGIGHEVELALVGDDLVVGNDTLAFATLLDPSKPAAVTAATPRKGLAADPHYRVLSTQSKVGAGALRVYVDWPRLGQRLRPSLEGLPGALLRSSGLDSARGVMLTVEGSGAAFAVKLLLDLPKHGAGGRPDGRTHGGGSESDAYSELAGWLASVQPVAPRALVNELPGGGLGGLVLSVDLARMLARSPSGEHLLHDLEHAFDEYGLDFQRNVLSRLGAQGTVQLQLARSGRAGAELRSVYALRTKGRNAAVDLLGDVRRATEAAGIGRLVPMRERRLELVEIRSAVLHASVAYLAAHEDDLLLSSDAESLAAAIDDMRSVGRARTRRDQIVGNAVQALGNERVAGLFDVDLAPLFTQFANAVTASGGARLDLSQQPKRHVGTLDVQRKDDGVIVRISVISSR
jgi:hypothetical protein